MNSLAKHECDQLMQEDNLLVLEVASCIARKYNLTILDVQAYISSRYSTEKLLLRGRRVRRVKKGLKAFVELKSGRTMVGEYLAVEKPSWYVGKVLSPSNRVHEHIIVYCETHGLTELPKGQVVHHKDLNKLNNDPSNLQRMTNSEHSKLHSLLRKGMKYNKGTEIHCKNIEVPID